MILEVAASETGRAQTGVRALRGSERGNDPKDLTERPGKAGQRGGKPRKGKVDWHGGIQSRSRHVEP